MSLRFDFATTGRILFGAGSAKGVRDIVLAHGRRPAVVTGRSRERVEALLEGVDAQWFEVSGEPTVEWAREAARVAREAGCDVVAGIGGGSALDAAKALAALSANPGDVLDYLEVVGRGQRLERPALPCIAVPTTAGTGSEVTRNAVLGSGEHRVKASLRSEYMLPRVAVVDPELTLTLPPAITASTGVDALTQLIEPYVSVRANALTDVFCLDGIARVAPSLRRAYEDGCDLDARADMSYASLLGGLSLANAGLGVVHGFAAPVGGMFAAPHGAVCAALLAPGMRENIRAARDASLPVLERYATVARVLTGKPAAAPEDGVEWVELLVRALQIPGLSAYGVTSGDIPVLVEKASQASSTKANPLPLSREAMERMAASALTLR